MIINVLSVKSRLKGIIFKKSRFTNLLGNTRSKFIKMKKHILISSQFFFGYGI